MNFTLQQLRAFLAVADNLNFSSAAQRLGVRQPTLSAAIKGLETALGARLLDRDTHRVSLTDLGRDLQSHARRVLQDVDHIQDDLRRRIQVRAGSIRLAALPYLFLNLLAPPLAEFHRLWPDIAFQIEDLSTNDSLDLLRAGHVDLVVGNEVADAPDLRCQFLAERRFVAVMPQAHPLAAHLRLPWAALDGQQVIVVKSREINESLVLEPLRQAGLLPKVSHPVHQLSTALGLVEAGFGIAMMGQHTASAVLRPGWVARPMVEPELVGRLSLMTLANRALSPPEQALQEVLLAHFQRRHPTRGEPARALA